MPSTRNFTAAIIDRLTADWSTTIASGNRELRQSLKVLRARARNLAQNNDYARKFLHLVRNNVVGPRGLALQMRVARADGSRDDAANRAIEQAWAEWGKRGACTACGTMSWSDAQRLFMTSVARDGEVLVRLIRGFPNDYGFALEFIEADHLDEELNVERGVAAPGIARALANEIRMGVERDTWGRPVAYYLLTVHPGDDAVARAGRVYRRVPAAEIIHGFMPDDRVGAARGLPWMHAAMTRLNMIGGYEEAELVAARVGAAKMGFYKTREGASYSMPGEKDAAGNIVRDASPGHFEMLPAEIEDVVTFDPEHPTAQYRDFIKGVLRGAASGLGVSYNSLANDLEGVNFSSIRHGVLEDRDEWRTIQDWLAGALHQRVFEAWLDVALLSGALPLPASDFERLNAANWQPRGWQWVDPEKEVAAHERAIALSVRTRADIAAEQGRDLEDIFRQLAAERDLASALGIELTAAAAPQRRPEPTETMES